eukprot:265226_1
MNKQLDIHNQLYEKLTTYPDTVKLSDYFDKKESETQKEMMLKKQIKKDIENIHRLKRKIQEQNTMQFENESVEAEQKTEEIRTENKPKTVRNIKQHKISRSKTHNAYVDITQTTENMVHPQSVQTPSNIQNAQNVRNIQNTQNSYNMNNMQNMNNTQNVHDTNSTQNVHSRSIPQYPNSPYGGYPTMSTYSHPMHYQHMMHPPPQSYPMNMMQHQWNPNTNAVMSQMNKQFEVTQKLLKQHELETELLQNEIKNMHKKQEDDKINASKQEFQNSLHMLRSKLMGNSFSTNADSSFMDSNSASMHNKHGSLNELNDFEKEERKLLTLIATFSDETDLKKLYVNQLRSITSTKFELEQLLQHKKLQKIKHEISAYDQQLTAESEHENWLKEQKRLLERNKIEKELAAQGLLLIDDKKDIKR